MARRAPLRCASSRSRQIVNAKGSGCDETLGCGLTQFVIWLLLIPMAFSDQQLKQIERQVGGLCERRSPAHVRDKFRLRYEVNNHHVFVREARPEWHDPSEWIESDVAKLRYVAASNEWRLYWKRASGKWWLYE